MHKLNSEKYLQVGHGSVALKDRIDEVSKAVSKRGYDNIFLVGSGGSAYMFDPYEYYLRTESTIPAYLCVASELMQSGNTHLGSRSVCILTSSSGTTEETVAAAAYCREKGATTICISGKADVPYARDADYAIVNTMDDFSAADADYLVLDMLVFSLMYRHGDFPDYEDFCANIKKMPEQLISVKEQADAKALEYARAHHDDEFTMYVGGASIWGETEIYAICILCEMQWKKTMAVKTADFFHGPLELLTDEKVHVVLCMGEDDCRPQSERVLRFLQKYCKNYTVFDTKDYQLEGIDPKYRRYLSPVILCAALDRLSMHMEDATGHSLDIRKYYKVVEY